MYPRDGMGIGWDERPIPRWRDEVEGCKWLCCPGFMEGCVCVTPQHWSTDDGSELQECWRYFLYLSIALSFPPLLRALSLSFSFSFSLDTNKAYKECECEHAPVLARLYCYSLKSKSSPSSLSLSSLYSSVPLVLSIYLSHYCTSFSRTVSSPWHSGGRGEG